MSSSDSLYNGVIRCDEYKMNPRVPTWTVLHHNYVTSTPATVKVFSNIRDAKWKRNKLLRFNTFIQQVTCRRTNIKGFFESDADTPDPARRCGENLLRIPLQSGGTTDHVRGRCSATVPDRPAHLCPAADMDSWTLCFLRYPQTNPEGGRRSVWM